MGKGGKELRAASDEITLRDGCFCVIKTFKYYTHLFQLI
jgi:hypothetical protein